MSNHALEEKVKTLSSDYIYHQAVGSMLLLLMSQMEQEFKNESVLHLTIPEEIRQIEKKIRTYVLDLQEILDGEMENRTLALEECMGLKKELLDIYEIIYSYFSQWNILSAGISDQIALRKYKEDNLAAKQVDYSLFFGDCHAFLESASTVLEQKKYMGQLLKCIPLFVTRDKFYDTVLQSLELAFTGESTELIEASLRAFEGFSCPRNNPKYGVYFSEIADWIGAKGMLLPHKMSDDELADTYDDFNTTFELLQDIEEYFSCILHDINSLILLFYLSYTFTDLTGADVTHSDLYHAVCEYISGEWNKTEKGALEDTLNEQLEDATEKVIDASTAIGKKEYNLLQKIDSFDVFTEDTQKLLLTEEFIRNCFFGNLNDELFRFDIPDTLPMATTEEKNALFGNFITTTKNSFETLPVQTRKIAMQTLASALPSVYQVQDFMNLIMDSIDQVSTDEQRILIVDKVGTVFADCGYESIPSNAQHDHHHTHEHGHDCGCGHDHHDHHEHHEHHHDCGCGHDHHDH